MIQNRTKFIFILLIIVVGLAVYSNSLNNEFIWDDELLIISNDYIKHLKNIPGLFTHHIAYGTEHQNNFYRPLQMLTYSLNYAVWKLDVRAYHLTNIVIHILVALALFWLAQLLGKNTVLSLIAALLFISHPIHTEAVTYISGRADLLAALFILLCAVFYIKYCHRHCEEPCSSASGNETISRWRLLRPFGARNDKKKYTFYFLSLTSFLLALLSKEIAIVVPLLLLAYDYIYRKQKQISFKTHLPFFFLGLIYIVLRMTILHFPGEKSVVAQVSFLLRLLVIFRALTMYFHKLLIPLNLHMEYELFIPPITDVHLILGVAIAPILILTTIKLRKRKNIVSFCLAWFLLNYLPISNIYPLNATFAEHWIYVPALGLFILAGWLVVKMWEKGRIFKQLTSLVLAFLLIDNFCLTLKQNLYWKNPEDFYQRTLKYTPDSWRVYYQLGRLYLRKDMIDKAIEKLNKSIELSPYFLSAYQILATAYIEKGWSDKSIDVCEKALKLDPDSSILRNTLGLAYVAEDQNEKAIFEFKRAISLNPNYALPYNNLGSSYANMGKRKEAIAAFKKALEINPDYAGAHQNLARAFYDERQYDLAIKHCERARELGLNLNPELLELLQPFR